LETAKASVFVDLGLGARTLARRLYQTGLRNRRVSAIFVTHSHVDHVAGILPYASRNQVRVFMTEGTWSELPGLRELPHIELLKPGSKVEVCDLCVESFSIPHDTAQPVGFRFEGDGVAGALATDLGELAPSVCARLAGCDWLALESNHDEELLRIGPYPWPLKRRLLSSVGHLSNRALAEFLAKSFDGRARHIFLAHLSRQNNAPGIALETARRALASRRDAGPDWNRRWRVHLTDQFQPSIVVDVAAGE
jgi:phosphoribosyl 1,2-cyclic phosphodiesterase